MTTRIKTSASAPENFSRDCINEIDRELFEEYEIKQSGKIFADRSFFRKPSLNKNQKQNNAASLNV